MLPYFQALGDAVALAWSAVDCDESQLVGIASGLLRERPAPAETSMTAVLDWVASVRADSFVQQGDIVASFGEPPVTVYMGEGFRIDVNLWASSTMAIHEHGFAGAFQVLHGGSLQSLYAFEPHREIGAGMVQGELELLDMHRLRVGDVFEIPPGPSLIHGLFHLDHPSATVIIRSNGSDRWLPQYNYDPPGLAVDGRSQATFSPLMIRRLQLMGFAQRAALPDADDRVAAMLAGADPAFAYHFVTDVLPGRWRQKGLPLGALPGEVQRWLSDVAFPDEGARDVVVAAAIRKVLRQDAALRRDFLTGVEDRLMAGLLVNAPNRAALDQAMTREFQGQSPHQTMLEFLDRLATIRDARNPEMCAIGMHENAVAILRMIVDERLEDFESLLVRLRQVHPNADVDAERDGLVALDHELRHLGLFAPWFRTG
jgi:hypothetical protein